MCTKLLVYIVPDIVDKAGKSCWQNATATQHLAVIVVDSIWTFEVMEG